LRKRIEEVFGWAKTVGGLMQIKVRRLAKVRAAFVFATTSPACPSLGPEGRSASGGMESKKTMTRSHAKTSK
jgi:hypothetical protein